MPEVVEHDRLVLGVAELLVDLERPPRVGRPPPDGPTRPERPVERVAGVRERPQLANRFGLRDRLAAQPPSPRTSGPADCGLPPSCERISLATPSPRRRRRPSRAPKPALQPPHRAAQTPRFVTRRRRGDRTAEPARSGRRAAAGALRSRRGWRPPARRRSEALRPSAPRLRPARADRPTRPPGRRRSPGDTAAPRRRARTARSPAWPRASRIGVRARSRPRARSGLRAPPRRRRDRSCFEPQPNRLVQLAPQLERETPVGNLLQRGPSEAHVSVAVAGEYGRQPVPEPIVGQGHVRSEHVRQAPRIE